VGGDGDHALRGRPDHLEGVGGVGVAALCGGGAAPQVDDALSVEVDAAGGADLAVVLEVGGEGFLDGLEAGFNGSAELGLDRRDSRVLFGGCVGRR